MIRKGIRILTFEELENLIDLKVIMIRSRKWWPFSILHIRVFYNTFSVSCVTKCYSFVNIGFNFGDSRLFTWTLSSKKPNG